MKRGDLVKIVRLYRGSPLDSYFGVLLVSRLMDLPKNVPGKSFEIRMLETNGKIAEFILDDSDVLEMVCEVW